MPRPDRLRRATLLLTLAAGLPIRARAQAFDLAALMALLARRRSAEARFVEERTVSSLEAPLVSKGTLSFTAPDRFARVTTEPRSESMEVQGNTAILRRGGRTRTLTLESIPELAALVDAVRGTLSGDAAMLKKHFSIEVGGQAARWSLVLVPVDAGLARQVRRIEIVGQRSDVISIELSFSGGDRSLMQITPLPDR